MRRDTPQDTSLAALRSVETLEAGYAAWAELRRSHAAQRLRRAEELGRLQGEGKFLLGAVRAAGETPTEAVSSDALATFSDDAARRLSAAQAEVQTHAREEEGASRAALDDLLVQLEARVRRYASQTPPSLVLWRRPLSGERAVLHLEAPPADASVLLLWLATGKLAARYDFLSDDSTEVLGEAPPSFYAETGTGGVPVPARPSPAQFPELVQLEGKVTPVKGFVPLFVPKGGQATFYRLLRRGPVLEAEVLDGGEFRSMLSGSEAELLAGHLLRWKLSGAIHLRIEMG